MKKILTIVCILNFLVSQGQGAARFFTKTNTFLKQHVKNGRVDYTAIKNNPSPLKELIGLAEEISVSIKDAATYQAFWINSYNLLVIYGIVENYPLESPLDVAGFFDKQKYEVGGENITLNDIENKLLRANFPSEARFHFVLVCAGLGCPPIIASAYMPNTLATQLQQQILKALNNPEFIKVSGKKVKVSQIFEWYKVDFELNGSDLVDFINTYRTVKLLESSKVSYYPYDWTLNDAN